MLILAGLGAIVALFASCYLCQKAESEQFKPHTEVSALKMAGLMSGMLLCLACSVAALGYIGITLTDHYFATKAAEHSMSATEHK